MCVLDHTNGRLLSQMEAIIQCYSINLSAFSKTCKRICKQYNIYKVYSVLLLTTTFLCSSFDITGILWLIYWFKFQAKAALWDANNAIFQSAEVYYWP